MGRDGNVDAKGSAPAKGRLADTDREDMPYQRVYTEMPTRHIWAVFSQGMSEDGARAAIRARADRYDGRVADSSMLVKIGAKVGHYARRMIFQIAEVAARKHSPLTSVSPCSKEPRGWRENVVSVTSHLRNRR